MEQICLIPPGGGTSLNNEKGAALIELCLTIPLMFLILSLLELAEQGWTFRIRNRMISRYSAVTSFRNNKVTALSLKQRFNLDGVPVSCLSDQTTQIILSPHLLNSRIKLKQTTYIYRPPKKTNKAIKDESVY
jgi:hypothetical protein